MLPCKDQLQLSVTAGSVDSIDGHAAKRLDSPPEWSSRVSSSALHMPTMSDLKLRVHLDRLRGGTNLDLRDTGLDPDSIRTLAELMPGMAAVRLLNVSFNNCFGTQNKASYDPTQVHDVDKDQTGWRKICEALKGTAIETLVFSDIGAGPVALSTLAEAISDMAAVNELLLSGNPITGSRRPYKASVQGGWIDAVYDTDCSGLSHLCEAMKSSAVSKLDISNCHLGPTAFNTFSQFITDNAAIISLNVMKNPIGDKGIHVICEALKTTGTENLNLADTGMTVAGLTFLAADISEMAAIRELNVMNNPGIDAEHNLDLFEQLCKMLIKIDSTVIDKEPDSLSITVEFFGLRIFL
jgi:hypothetical protein